jgi:anti-sigma-K factor RskA
VNVKEYISSGIIESYVLGMLNDAEQQEFETVCAQYPEVAQAKVSFELSLETNLLKDAIAPPPDLKSRIEDQLFKTAEATETVEQVDEKDVIIRKIGMWKWVAAASLILLAGSLFWAITSNTKYQEAKQANERLQQEMSNTTAQLNELKNETSTLQKPGIKMAALQGTPVSPTSFVTVYWDTTSRDVYLMVNNLPQPSSNEQYQLWALLDNQPIDLGVFEVKQEKFLIRMKNVQNAQAFAITLEPKGGSANPSLNKMYVVGKL